MTDKQPDALRQAAWLKKEGASCQRHYDLGVLIERQHAELETLREKLKTMAEEHADELAVAHLDGRMRAAQPDLNLHCKSTQKRLATLWGFVPAPQQEAQEPVAWYVTGEYPRDAAQVQQARSNKGANHD